MGNYGCISVYSCKVGVEIHFISTGTSPSADDEIKSCQKMGGHYGWMNASEDGDRCYEPNDRVDC